LEVVLLFSSGGFIGLPTAQASVRRPTRGVAGVSVSARVGGYGAVTVDERVAAAATVQVIRMLTSVLYFKEGRNLFPVVLSSRYALRSHMRACLSHPRPL
jgi:hypothetical protein